MTNGIFFARLESRYLYFLSLTSIYSIMKKSNLFFKKAQGVLFFALTFAYVIEAQTPIPLAFGGCLEGALPTQSSSITYQTPPVQPGDQMLIRVKESGVKLKFELYPPLGPPINTIYGSSTADLLQTIYTIPPGGQIGNYRIIVSSNGTFAGNFSIALEQMNEPESALFLGCGNSLSGNLNCGPIIKAYRFLMQGGSLSRITVAPSGTAPEAWLCERDGQILRHQASSLGQVITFDTIPVSETSCLYVFVASSNGFFYNNYSISHTTLSGSCGGVSLQSLPNSSSICEGETFTLSASSPIPNATYEWNGPNGFTSTQQEIIFTDVTQVQSGTYTVTTYTPTTCSSTASKLITIHPSPTAVASVAPPTVAVCAGQSFTLNVVTDAASPSYAWTGPGGYSSTIKSPVIATADTSQTELRVYTVTVTNGSTGCTNTSSIAVQVNSRPTAVINSPINSSVCTGTTLSLNVTTNINASDATFSWSGPGGFTSSEQNPTIPNVTTSNQGTYSVTVTNVATECSRTASKAITVNFSPTANISGNLSICAGASTVLFASGGGSYAWSNGGTTSSITVSPLQTTTYTVTVTNTTNGCTDTESKILTVKPLPLISITSTPNNPEICSGDGTILLCATSNAENPSYQWTSTNFVSTSQCVTFDSPAESGTYVASVTDGISGCSNTESLPIIIHQTPTVSILQTPQPPFCNGVDFTLCATSNASIPSYQWTGPNNFTGSSLCVPINDASVAQSGIYSVTVTSSSGCVGISNLNIEVGTQLQCISSLNNGTITATATGSFPPYNFTLSPGGQTNSTGIFHNLGSGTYGVDVTDSNWCMCSTGLLTGIMDPIKAWGLSIAPNPSSGIFEIAVGTIRTEALKFVLFDLTGRQLRTFTMKTPLEILDLTDLPGGVYLLKVSDNRNSETIRLISTR